MPLFALPITTASSAPQSRVRFSSLPVRKKRKRDASLSDDEDDDAKSQYSRSEAAASTNPLSLTPEEVVQYRLAGLELDEEIPSVKGWPHRGLPAEPTYISKKYAQADIEDKRDHEAWQASGREEEREPRLRLRLQHISVLTAILQKSLLEGNIQRASRAWAILIRAQVGGHGMDLRASGYWAIGAELLIRSSETHETKSPRRRDSMAGNQDEEDEAQHSDEADTQQHDLLKYGSAEGMAKAKEFYERLILQHPYTRQFKDNISAVDFWPAMLGCEIYGIQKEYQDRVRKLASAEENDDDNEAEGQSDSDLESGGEVGEDMYAVEERRTARQRLKRDEKLWQKRDDIRKKALIAYEQIAARLDDLMTTPPYSDSHVLLRLRGMLALCIGDLMVPALPGDDEAGKEEDESRERLRRLEIGDGNTERRFLLRQRIADHERGRKKQREEHIRARTLFEKIERESNRKESVTNSLPGDENAEGAE